MFREKLDLLSGGLLTDVYCISSGLKRLFFNIFNNNKNNYYEYVQ